MNEPVICFGQQPNGFFPKRFFVAKIQTARALQNKIGRDAWVGAGGKIVFFYHDSDADYRETITIMRDRQTGAEARLNFLQPNKIQKKFSPLYTKKIAGGWKQETLKQLPRFVDKRLIDVFSSTDENLSVANFCLEMYKKTGLLGEIEIVRSSDKNFRGKALDLEQDYFADVEYQGEIVRAKIEPSYPPTTPTPSVTPLLEKEGNEPASTSSGLAANSPPAKEEYPAQAGGGGKKIGILHQGGNKFIRFPINQPIEKWQKSPGRDRRFAWMQSVINCTHYIIGESEKEYLDKTAHSEVKFIEREKIENPNYAWLG